MWSYSPNGILRFCEGCTWADVVVDVVAAATGALVFPCFFFAGAFAVGFASAAAFAFFLWIAKIFLSPSRLSSRRARLVFVLDILLCLQLLDNWMRLGGLRGTEL